ncbi:MAG: helix-turn-helix transcriptional regulator [Actinocatenispora sp.]
MGVPFSPIVRRQRLGVELRTLRDARALTGRQVVEQLGWRSQSKLTRIEKGASRVEVGDVLDLLDLYGVTGAEREKLVVIAREAADRRALGRSIPGVGDRQRGYAQIESGAALIREYTQFLVPGLLQTPEYTRARIGSGVDVQEGVDVDIDARARELRQELLVRSTPPRYEAVIEECALRRAVAPPPTMRNQLRHLLTVAELPHVSVRVLLMDRPVANFFVPHSSFSIYRFADPDDPTVVVLETLTSDVGIRDRDETEPYEVVYDWVKKASLSEESTLRMIRTLVE